MLLQKNELLVFRPGTIIFNAKSESNQTSEYNFFVKATNSKGKSVMIPIYVKLTYPTDGLTPVFSYTPQKVLLMENSPIGTFVADFGIENAKKVDLLANSPSNSTSNRLVAALAVDKSGMLRTFAPLSGFKDGEYRLEIKAENGDQKVGEEFQLVFNVSTTSTQETSLAKIQAQIQENCQLLYAIEGNFDQTSPVIIDPETGVLSTNSKEWDETQERLPLIIVARSGHLFSRIGVEMRRQPVSKEFQPKPMFLQNHMLVELLEDAPLNSTVGRVRAQGGQLPVYYYLPLDYSVFGVHPVTGRIHTTQLLDRDNAMNKFTLKVYASYDNPTEFVEKEREEFAVVDVYVLDVNDNDPKFDQPNYEFVMDADSLVGTALGKVRAFDIDSSTDSLTFSLESAKFLYKNTSRRDSASMSSKGHGRRSLQLVNQCLGCSNQGHFRSSFTHAMIWLCDAQSDIVPMLLAENPRGMNSTKLREYLRVLSEASSAKVLLQEMRYRTLQSDATGDNPPLEVEKIIRELKMPEVMALEKAFASTSFNPEMVDANGETKSSSEDSSLLSSLVILCYHRRQFLRQQDYMKNERIAKSTLNTSSSVSSTLRQFSFQPSYPAPYPSYEPSMDSMWDQRQAPPLEHYYTIQEKKICL
uniref:Cadherin domain-containing protein n=1 Tax=Ditylenchus dipsaci TaxID=166011 RepID=A0A915DLS4_9BILA